LNSDGILLSDKGMGGYQKNDYHWRFKISFR